jgi:3-deoxy-D-manno-octulosonic-acid transferase
MWKVAYNLLLHAALPFFAAYSLTNRKIRANFLERIYGSTTEGGTRRAIWIHAASVGEAIIAENIVAHIRDKAQSDFVITTNTYYARDMLRQKFGDTLQVLSLPFDLPWSIRHFLGKSTFACLVLIETELWPNLIWAARKRRIPVIIVNGRISDATIGRYKHLAFFLRKVLTSVDVVLAQSEEHARRFVSLGMAPAKVINAGNLKYYRELTGSGDVLPKEQMVTFGSIRERELTALVPAIARLREEFPDIRIFVAPRDLGESDTLEKQLSAMCTCVRYSAVKRGEGIEGPLVIVDTVGDLMQIYRRSRVAFVGGSLAPYGGQNILEPLFVGTPVIFGPSVENFSDIAKRILAAGAGFMVNDGQELLQAIRRTLTEPGLWERLADAGRHVLDEQKGTMEGASRMLLETVWKTHSAD